LKNVVFTYPSAPTQDRIVRWLDWQTSRIAHYTRAKKREIECLRELKKAIVSEVVTKGDKEWETKRLPVMFAVSRGLSISRNDMKSEGVPCIHYGDIHGHCGFEVDPEKHKLGCVSEKQINGRKDAYLEYGDFLFCGSSEDLEGSGNFTYFNSHAKAVCGTDTIKLRAKQPLNYRFIAYLFDSQQFRNQIRMQVSGVKVFHPTQAIIKQTVLHLPPTEEQQSRIVAYLDEQCAAIDAVIAKLSREIELVSEYKASIISDAVTGKIDLRNAEIPDFEPENESVNDFEEETENDDD
jgi:type I restriction enzyme S subunit